MTGFLDLWINRLTIPQNRFADPVLLGKNRP